MSGDDPQTDAERDDAICFVVTRRKLPERWRPYGVALGTVARDRMIADLRERHPDIEAGWVSLEAAHG